MPLEVTAELSLQAANGEAVTVTADGAVVTVSLPSLRPLRGQFGPLADRQRRAALLARLQRGLQVADLTLQVKLRGMPLAQLAPHARPTALSRLLGVGPLRVRPWSVLSALLRR
jgi:antitoxin (DNA-binding transcriptional repressor) of toxin-antitoxin stability system